MDARVQFPMELLILVHFLQSIYAKQIHKMLIKPNSDR